MDFLNQIEFLYVEVQILNHFSELVDSEFASLEVLSIYKKNWINGISQK